MAEYLDLLNEDGIKTGDIATRKDVHKYGYWHRAVIAAVVNSDNKVLMQRRSEQKEKYPGLWDLSTAGHVMAGESSLTTCVRELNEEIGIQIGYKATIQDFRFVTCFRNTHSYINKNNEDITVNQYYDLFVIRKDIDLSQVAFNDDEVSDTQWMDYTQILKYLKEGKLHPRTEWISEVFSFINKM